MANTTPQFINYSYIYFDVKDYSNNRTLSSYTLENTPLVFIPNLTTSALLTATDAISNKYVQWNFGDGTFSNDLTATHRYKWPGIYKPVLTVYNRQGVPYDSSYQPLIEIKDFVPDALIFRDSDKFFLNTLAGKLTEPIDLYRYNSWQSYPALSSEGYTINLYASGALGEYLDLDRYTNDKWGHLRKTSRFYIKKEYNGNEEYTVVDSLCTNSVEIYTVVDGGVLTICSRETPNSVFAGTSGQKSIYYADDYVKNFSTRNAPIFIFANFDSSKFSDSFTIKNDAYRSIRYMPIGYQNLKPAIFPFTKIRFNPADKLSISTTGIDGEGTLSTTVFNIPKLSWSKTEIPFVIKLKDNENFTTKTYQELDSSTIHPNLSNVQYFNLQLALLEQTDNGVRPITAVKFYDDFGPDIPKSIGGFYKGYFVADTTSNNCFLSASMVIRDVPNMFLDTIFGWIALPQFNKLQRYFKQEIYSYCTGLLTLTLSAESIKYDSRSNRNVYAIQVIPSGSDYTKDFQTWFADGSRDTLFKFDVNGNMLSSFSLSSYPLSTTSGINYIDLRSPQINSAAPGSLALDSRNDLWMTLFDSVSVLKLDCNTGFIKSVAYPANSNIVYLLSSDYNLPQLSGFAGENLFLPSSVDTDVDNNIWVTYTHPASNFLIKYDTYGQLLTTIVFPKVISPVEVVIDRDNNAWLTAYNLISGYRLDQRDDFLYKFNNKGDLLSGYPIKGFKNIGNLTIDTLQNAIVFENQQTVTKINKNTLQKTYFKAGSANQTTYIGSAGGIACDTGDFVWVINNFDQRLYFIDSYQEPTDAYNNMSWVKLEYPPESVENVLSSFQMKQFQAYGDWLGQRWSNKYAVKSTLERVITGSSNLFKILPYTGEYNVYKVNEDFNAEEFYYSLAYNDLLSECNKFFKSFLGTIVGGVTAQPYELGKTVYEKIANFVSNKSDIDLVNLDSLLSMCNELSVQFEQYNYPFPPQIERLVNLLSIKHKKLWGDKNKYDLNFDNKLGSYPISKATNLGDELSVLTSRVTAYTPVIAYEIFSNTYTVVNRTLIPGLNINESVPLSSFNYNWAWGLVLPAAVSGVKIKDYYKFYKYIEKYNDNVYDNIIDWNNPHTTLSYSNSSFNEWSKVSGIMENILSYELTKGLRLILSASDLVYNN